MPTIQCMIMLCNRAFLSLLGAMVTEIVIARARVTVTTLIVRVRLAVAVTVLAWVLVLALLSTLVSLVYKQFP